MRKYFFGCMVIIIFSFSLFGEEVIFNTQDFPPFCYEEEGVVKGPVAEIIIEIANEMNIQYCFRILPWIRAQREVEYGKAHGLFVIGWNEQRALWLHFSPPVLETEYGFFVGMDDDLDYREIGDLDGYIVGVYGTSNTSISLEKLYWEKENFTIDMTTDDRAAFLKLERGRVSAVYSNLDVGIAMLKRLNIQNVRYAGIHKKLNYYIGFSLKYNNPVFLEEFDKTFLRLYKEGIIPRILESYDLRSVEIE